MIKEYFTDGLLQIAIVLSLLRTDLDTYITAAYAPYGVNQQLHETLLGSLSGYTQTDFHAHNRWNAGGIQGFVHPKNIDNFYSDSIFRDLHLLSDYRRFDGVNTNINTWLVNEPDAVVPSRQRLETETQSNTDGGNGNIGIENTNSEEPEGAAGNLDFSAYFGSDLTKEDMDLIEVLWRQDIDLGVGREMFDVNLRQELERESELRLRKQQEELLKEKENKTERESESFLQLDLSGNYVIDGETGELIPGPPLTEQEPTVFNNLLALSNFQDSSLPDHTPSIRNNESGPFDNTFYNMEGSVNTGEDEIIRSYESGNILQSEPHQNLITNDQEDFQTDQFERQNSFEERWQDVLGLLDLPDSQNILSLSSSSSSSSSLELELTNPEHMNQPVVQNISLADTNYSDNLSLSQRLIFTSQPSMNHFPVIEMNNSMYMPSNVTLDLMQDILPTDSYLNTTTDGHSISSSMNNEFGGMRINQLGDIDTTQFGGMNINQSIGMNMNPLGGLNISQLGVEMTNLTEFSSLNAVASLFEQLINNDNVNDIDLIDMDFDFVTSSNVEQERNNDDLSSDSAVSSMLSPEQWCNNLISPSDGVDEATGGKDDNSKYETDYGKYEYDPSPRTRYNSASPNPEMNSSCSSNDTSFRSSKATTKQIYHNHTYVLPPGQVRKEEKETAAAIKREKDDRIARSRDEKKAKEMKIPFTVDDIINTPVEEFTEMLARYSLSELQHQLIRDIRRRGKNKQAAQNCRKRKLDVIQTLDEEVAGLQQQRQALTQERRQIDRETAQLKDKFIRLQEELFKSLRDDKGRQYDPNEYALQQMPDGNVFLVPKNNSSGVATDQNHSEKPGRKRKPKRKD